MDSRIAKHDVQLLDLTRIASEDMKLFDLLREVADEIAILEEHDWTVSEFEVNPTYQGTLAHIHIVLSR
jgi:hypothetical protein